MLKPIIFASAILSSSALPAVFSSQLSPDLLPSSYDLRDIDGHSYIGAVRDQGSTGTCYAFAACAVAEAAYNRANGLYDDNCADFSEAYIAWTLSPYYLGLAGGDGANYLSDELQTFVDYGACLESVFPYTAVEPDNAADYLDCGSILFSGWYSLPQYDLDTIKMAIYRYGAVVSSIYAHGDFYKYQSGIYSNDDVAADNIYMEGVDMNHRIALIGWSDDTNTWIMRNSWGTEVWGESGYANLDYYSAKATLDCQYVTYEPWSGDDFDLTVDSVVKSQSGDEVDTRPGDTVTSYGLYYWAGNNTTINNESTISSIARSSVGNAFSHGLFLFAGDNSTITNQRQIISGALAHGDLMATAYGVCFQGEHLVNTGNISAIAMNEDTGPATSFGVWFSSFDTDGTLDNSGYIMSIASGPDSYAIGLQAARAASVSNSGNIDVISTYQGSALVSDRSSVLNTGQLTSDTETSDSYGAILMYSTLDNASGGYIHSSSDDGTAYGVYVRYSSTLTNGDGAFILAESLTNTVTGVLLNKTSTATNESGGVITAYSGSGMALGLLSDDSGHFYNMGTCTAVSDSGDAKGANLLSGSTLTNEDGWISAISTDGVATGVSLSDSSTLYSTSTGLIQAVTSTGIQAVGLDITDSRVLNSESSIYAEANDGACAAVDLRESSLLLNVAGVIYARSDNVYASGVICDESAVSNIDSGLIMVTSVSGTAVGVDLRNAFLCNGSDCTISAESETGDAYGIEASESTIINDGTIRGTLSVLDSCNVLGNGVFDSSLEATDSFFSPGVASIGSLSVTGDLTASGTFNFNMGIDSTGFDTLIVGGAADLSASDNVLTFLPDGYIATGDYTFIASDGAEGTFDVVFPAVIYTGDVSAGVDGFTLNLLRRSYSFFVQGDALKTMALAFDKARLSSSGWIGEELIAMDFMTSGADLAATLTDIFPAVNQTATNMALGSVQNMNTYLSGRGKNTDGMRDHCWFGLLNGNEPYAAADGFTAYWVNRDGMIAGADHRLNNDHWAVGLAVARQRETAGFSGSGNAEVKSHMASVYASWDRDPEGFGPYVRASVGAGGVKIRSTRAITHIDELLSSKRGGEAYAISLSSGWDFDGGDGAVLSPFVGLNYAALRESSYAESDAAGAALSFDDARNDSLRGAAGFSLRVSKGSEAFRIIPEVRLTCSHEFMKDNYGTTASFADGTAFHAVGRALPGNAVSGDFIMRAIILNRVSVVADYSRTSFQKEDHSESFSLSAQVAF